VDHDDDVCSKAEGFVITGLLIASVAPVLLMPDNMPDVELPGNFDGTISTGIIDQDYIVHKGPGYFLIGVSKRFLRVIGRADHHYFFILQHIFFFILLFIVLCVDNFAGFEDSGVRVGNPFKKSFLPHEPAALTGRSWKELF